MGLTQVNWTPDRLSGLRGLSAALTDLPQGGRITIMVHGFRFDPADPDRSPHTHILSPTPRPDCWKALSWPKHLHLDRTPGHLGIAFGWPALGWLGPIAERAFAAGDGMARLLHHIHGARPDLSVGILAHSLGARVALAGLAQAPTDLVRRVILLAGAEYRDTARAALAMPGAQGCIVVNIRSHENLPFDLAFRAAVPAPHLRALPLSAGLDTGPAWRDLRIDCAQTRAHLRALGHRIAAPRTRVCHWSGYLRPGLFAIYRRLLDPAETRFLDEVTAPGRTATPGGELAPALSPLPSGLRLPI